MSYTLITKAEKSKGNMACSLGKAIAIGFGLANTKPDEQVFFTGEIVLSDERCCEGGRKYWRWGIKYEEGFKSINNAKKRAKELKIKPIVHEKCHKI